MPDFSAFSTPIIFVVMFLILVVVHELGHFVTAKRAGVQVDEFGFGFPPRLFALRRGETEYSLNLLPLGGFVRMLGEEDPTHPRSLAARPAGTRLLVIGAGPVMNMVLAVLLFGGSFMLPRETRVGPVQVARVMPGSPAELAGVQPGDVILQVNDRPIRSLPDVHYNILLNVGSEVTFRLQRDGGQSEARMTPRWKPPPGEGEVGIVIGMPQEEIVTVSYAPWEALFLGARQSFDILSLTRNGILSMFARGFQSDAVVGPVGIYQATDRVAQTGTGNLIYLAAFLSMNLGILNILPIPALDGGRILFILLELVRGGRRVAPRKEGFVHLVGFGLLLALIVVITLNDVLRIVRGENLFQ